MAAPSKDISGQTFGKLTALAIVGKYRRENVWECACECGNKVRVKICNLRSGNTQSCGCARFKGGNHENQP